jgi:hypothetical protein
MANDHFLHFVQIYFDTRSLRQDSRLGSICAFPVQDATTDAPRAGPMRGRGVEFNSFSIKIERRLKPARFDACLLPRNLNCAFMFSN